jgi:hypothetical protein
MQFMDERAQSRKKKIDTHGDAIHTLDEQTKKQLKIFVAQQVDYNKQIWRLSEISHDYMDFFGFVPPFLIGGIQCTTCGKKDIILKFAWSGIHVVLIVSTMATIQGTARWRSLPH